MIYRVYNSFLNSIVWIVPKTFCLLSTRNLTHMLFEHIALDNMLPGFQPFLNSMRLDSIFCLLSRSFMFIASAIFLFYTNIQKSIYSFVQGLLIQKTVYIFFGNSVKSILRTKNGTCNCSICVCISSCIHNGKQSFFE